MNSNVLKIEKADASPNVIDAREKVRLNIQAQIKKFKLPPFKYYDVPESHNMHNYFPAAYKMPFKLPPQIQKGDPSVHLESYFDSYASYKARNPNFEGTLLSSRRERPVKKRKVNSSIFSNKQNILS